MTENVNIAMVLMHKTVGDSGGVFALPIKESLSQM